MTEIASSFELIPAIDLLDGKAVRLRKGRYEEVTVYPDPPEDLAGRWSSLVRRLHVVDLEGARSGRARQTDSVRRILASFGAGVQVGGGIRSLSAVESYLELGAERVVLGTAALKDPELVRHAAEQHPHKIIVAVDARNGFVATEGWLEGSERRAVELVQELVELPLSAVLYTDIERDGTEVGPNVAETTRLARETNAHVLASGGVGTLAHVRSLAAAARSLSGPGRIVGAIVGRALHEQRFSLEDALAALLEQESVA